MSVSVALERNAIGRFFPLRDFIDMESGASRSGRATVRIRFVRVELVRPAELAVNTGRARFNWIPRRSERERARAIIAR